MKHVFLLLDNLPLSNTTPILPATLYSFSPASFLPLIHHITLSSSTLTFSIPPSISAPFFLNRLSPASPSLSYPSPLSFYNHFSTSPLSLLAHTPSPISCRNSPSLPIPFNTPSALPVLPLLPPTIFKITLRSLGYVSSLLPRISHSSPSSFSASVLKGTWVSIVSYS